MVWTRKKRMTSKLPGVTSNLIIKLYMSLMKVDSRPSGWVIRSGSQICFAALELQYPRTEMRYQKQRKWTQPARPAQPNHTPPKVREPRPEIWEVLRFPKSIWTSRLFQKQNHLDLSSTLRALVLPYSSSSLQQSAVVLELLIVDWERERAGSSWTSCMLQSSKLGIVTTIH